MKHMTNTRVSDCEILEKRYPILVKQFSLRHGSGGEGLHPGGDGAIRGFEARAPITFSLSTERRVHRPYGMAGGGPGKSGRNLALLKLPDGRDRWVNVGGKGIIKLRRGEQLFIHTPGGGAWGSLPNSGISPGNNYIDGIAKNAEEQHWRGMGSLHNFSTAQNEG